MQLPRIMTRSAEQASNVQQSLIDQANNQPVDAEIVPGLPPDLAGQHGNNFQYGYHPETGVHVRCQNNEDPTQPDIWVPIHQIPPADLLPPPRAPLEISLKRVTDPNTGHEMHQISAYVSSEEASHPGTVATINGLLALGTPGYSPAHAAIAAAVTPPHPLAVSHGPGMFDDLQVGNNQLLASLSSEHAEQPSAVPLLTKENAKDQGDLQTGTAAKIANLGKSAVGAVAHRAGERAAKSTPESRSRLAKHAKYWIPPIILWNLVFNAGTGNFNPMDFPGSYMRQVNPVNVYDNGKHVVESTYGKVKWIGKLAGIVN